jgi:hypothetical protein
MLMGASKFEEMFPRLTVAQQNPEMLDVSKVRLREQVVEIV